MTHGCWVTEITWLKVFWRQVMLLSGSSGRLLIHLITKKNWENYGQSYSWRTRSTSQYSSCPQSKSLLLCIQMQIFRKWELSVARWETIQILRIKATRVLPHWIWEDKVNGTKRQSCSCGCRFDVYLILLIPLILHCTDVGINLTICS